jgi:hypothetical protein
MDAVDVLNGIIATKDAEIKQLRDDLARMYRLRREQPPITPEQRAVLDAAIGLHECSGADDTDEADDPRLAEWTDRLYAAIDALRAATPKHDDR